MPDRFITPEGLARIRAEYDELFGIERPKIVETVSWAASLGDRSENADYIYGKRRLREIDRRLAHLARIMKAAKVEKGSGRPHTDKIGKLTRAQAEEIARMKTPDLTAANLDAAVRTIAGSARSMGIVVEGVN